MKSETTLFLSPFIYRHDATIFISEYSLSRIASEAINQPAVVDFDPNGQMRLTTRVPVGRFEPTTQVAIQLEMEGPEVVSRLRWVKMSFLTVPATWLPNSALESVAIVGQTIEAQTPPDFTLVGLNTTPNGINFHLKWIGR